MYCLRSLPRPLTSLFSDVSNTSNTTVANQSYTNEFTPLSILQKCDGNHKATLLTEQKRATMKKPPLSLNAPCTFYITVRVGLKNHTSIKTVLPAFYLLLDLWFSIINFRLGWIHVLFFLPAFKSSAHPVSHRTELPDVPNLEKRTQWALSST